MNLAPADSQLTPDSSLTFEVNWEQDKVDVDIDLVLRSYVQGYSIRNNLRRRSFSRSILLISFSEKKVVSKDATKS